MIHAYAKNIVANAESKKKHHSKPQFKHDCTSCKYLGRYQNTESDGRTWNFDLYYCGDNPSHNKVRATVIARFGDEGSQYQSGLNGNLPELAEAKKRAIQKGYIKIKDLVESSPSATEIRYSNPYCNSIFLGQYGLYDLYWLDLTNRVAYVVNTQHGAMNIEEALETRDSLVFKEAAKRACEKQLYPTPISKVSKLPTRPLANETNKPRFKFAASEYLKFVCQSNLGMSPCDIYVDANGGIVAAYMGGISTVVERLDETYKGHHAFKVAQKILATTAPKESPSATEILSCHYIIGFTLMRIWPGGPFRTESKGRTFDYVSTTWANMNKDGKIESGATYIAASSSLFGAEEIKKLQSEIKIWKTRVEAERVIPLVQHQFPDCEFCAFPVMEKIEYSRESGLSEKKEVSRAIFFPTPGM
jgi:hypothetical protein